MNVQDIRILFLTKWCKEEFIEKENNKQILEIINASFIADENFIIQHEIDINEIRNFVYNNSRYKQVKKELQNNNFSYDAIINYFQPKYFNDGKYNSQNIIKSVQYLIRNNKLNAVVHMRMQDVGYDYFNNYLSEQFILKKLAEDLNLEVGLIHWNVGSLYIYDIDFWCFDFYLKYARWPEYNEKSKLELESNE